MCRVLCAVYYERYSEPSTQHYILTQSTKWPSMTTTMSQELLGRFDKSDAQKYLGMLQDEGIHLAVEDLEQTTTQPRVKVYVAKDQYDRAVELIKDFAMKVAIQAEEDKKRFDRKVMVFFFSFVCIFILYVIVTHI